MKIEIVRAPKPLYLYLIVRLDHVEYDEAAGFVVSAPSPITARRMISDPVRPDKQVGDEGREIWRDRTRTKCVKIGVCTTGQTGVLLCDFRAG